MTHGSSSIQARMGSTRLPGKVLADLGGRPMLALHARPAGAAVDVDQVVVATSDQPGDDAVAELAERAGVAVRAWVRARRARPVRDCARRATRPTTVVRLTADCPLDRPRARREAARPPSPQPAPTTRRTPWCGPSPTASTSRWCTPARCGPPPRRPTDPVEREHVTPFVYRRPERFRLAALPGPGAARATSGGPSTPPTTSTGCGGIVASLADPERRLARGAGRRRPTLRSRSRRSLASPSGRGRRRRDSDCARSKGDRSSGAGCEAPPPGPSRAYLGVLESGGRPIGWSQVAVHGGTGHLRCWSTDDSGPVLRRLTEQALEADRQVRRLVVNTYHRRKNRWLKTPIRRKARSSGLRTTWSTCGPASSATPT